MRTGLIPLLLICGLFYMGFGQEEKKEEFRPSGRVWGYAFGDLFYKIQGDSGRPKKWGDGEFSQLQKNYYAFSFRRIYLGYDYEITEKFSSKILLEGRDEVLIGTDRGVFIKLLLLKWKNALPLADLLIGQIPTPTWGAISEKEWSYRSVEKTLLDFRKLGAAVDVGLALDGRIGGTGNYGYYLLIGNGRSAKPENNRLKKYYAQVYAKILDKKLILESNLDFEPESGGKSKTTVEGFIGYQIGAINTGITVTEQIQKQYQSDSTNIVPMGVSFFVRGKLIPDKLNGFGRVDFFNPDLDYSESISSKHYDEFFGVAGIDWTPHKNVHLIPNLWVNQYSDKRSIETKRGADIIPRITFFFEFK